VAQRTRLVGINHVAFEVGDLDAALEFYGRIFELNIERRLPGMAFVSMGDQFLAISETRSRQEPDASRHFGLVVEDREAALAALREAGVELFGRGNDFLDPWGNFIQVVQYSDIQFTKTPEILEAMGLGDLTKSDSAVAELRAKGLLRD
jgi:catechol 2,3-dioxygenase-like lactoylglutathione lyase family enzyme